MANITQSTDVVKDGNGDDITIQTYVDPNASSSRGAITAILLKDGSLLGGTTAIPVSASSLPLPTSAATAANQATEIVSLASIDGKITACNTGAVVVSSSALPSGASTSANQTSGNASLSSIDGKITACNTGAVVISSGSTTVTQATATNLKAQVVGAGTAGAASGGVLTVQGDPSGTAIPVSATSLPLPSGASTETTLSALNTKVTVCNTNAVVVASSALPAGAATEATLSTMSTLITNAAQKTQIVDGSGNVIASSGNALNVNATGAATETTLSALNTKVTACNTGAVVVSSVTAIESSVLGTPITWQASGGSYAWTFTSVTNGNGRQGAKGDLGTSKTGMYMMKITSSVGSAATAGLSMDVYWGGSPNATAGSDNPGGLSGTDATFNTTPTEYAAQLQFVGSLVLSNNAGTGVQTQMIGPFPLNFRYGMPAVINSSGQTSGGTAGDHTITIYPVNIAG